MDRQILNAQPAGTLTLSVRFDVSNAVSAGLTPTQVEALLDPARYTGLCRQLAERGAAMGREIAATIERRKAGR